MKFNIVRFANRIVSGENISSQVSLSDIRGANGSNDYSNSTLNQFAALSIPPTNSTATVSNNEMKKSGGLTLQQKEDELRRQENEKKLKRYK